MSLTKIELETIINFNEAEDTASIYTCRPSLMRRIESFGVKPVERDKYSRTYEVPKNWFRDTRIGPPRKINISEEHREELRHRFQK